MGIQINGQTDNISAVDGSLTISGDISVAAGSTGSPSISPTGDSNTGIFFPAPDTVAIGEGGLEVIRVDSSGRVGVGTNRMTRPFEVWAGTAGTSFSVDTVGRVQMPFQPFAFVGRSSDVSFTSGSKFPYNTVVDSRGLTWDTTNNNFVVPATGVYTFTMVGRLGITNAGYMFFKILVNNTDIYGNGNLLFLQKPSTPEFQTCNVTISVRLTQNDTVHVTLSHNGTSPATILAAQSFMSITFNG
jgi:hypothetical protein